MVTMIFLGLLGCICASAMAGLAKRNFPVLLQGLNQKQPGLTGIPGTLGACLNYWALKGIAGGFEFIPRPAVTQVARTADTGTITSGMRLATLGTSLLMLTGSACYRKALDEWHSVEQNAPVVGVQTRPIATDALIMNAVDTAYVNGYYLNATAQGEGALGTIRLTVFDANGAAVISNLMVDSTGASGFVGVKIVVSGTLAVVFWEAFGSNKLRASKFDSSAPTTMTAPIDVATTFAAIPATYDAQVFPSTGKIAVAWTNAGTTQLNQVFVTPSTMAVSGLTTYAGITGLQTIGYATNNFSSSDFYLAHVDPVNGLRVSTFNATTLALGSTTVYDAASTGAINIAGNRAGASVSIYFTVAGTNAYDDLLKRSNGGAAAVICRGMDLASRVLSTNGTLYALARYRGPGQGHYFLLDLNGFNAVGKELPDLAFTGSVASIDQLPNLMFSGGLQTTFLTAGLKNLAVAVSNGTVGAYVGAVSMVWTISDSTVGRGVELNGGVHIPGAMPYLYDGSSLTEEGFPIAPEKFDNVVQAAGGSLTASSTYTYRDVYEWTDAAGNIDHSAPSPPQQVVLTAGNTKITRDIPTLRLTRKTNVAVASYRSPANGDGSVLYKINPANNPTVNVTTVDRVTVVDTLSDVALVAGEPIYVTGNVLENIAPPPCKAFAVHRGRLLVGGVDADPEAIWFSKEVSPGFGVSFNDSLVSRLSATEPVTAVASLDSQAVACTATTEWTSSTDYPDDTGGGGVLQFQQLSGMTGCTAANLIGRNDQGIMTWAGSIKGAWRQSRGGGFDYVGQNIEDEAQLAGDFTPSAIVAVPHLNQIRILGSWSHGPNGQNAVFVYETIFGTWSKWTYQATGLVDAVMWNGALTYLDGAGFIYTESLFLDTIDDTIGGVSAPIADGHSLSFSAFNFADIAGFFRVFEGQLTGRVYGSGATTANVVIAQTIDSVPGTVATKTIGIVGNVPPATINASFDPGTAGKCSQIAVTVNDQGAASNTSFALAGITFSVGIKPGLSRLPPARRAV